MFVKHFHRTGVAESQQYRFLQAHDAPVPRMFGALLGPDGREVLLLEYVETCHPVGTRRELLSMMARFNTIKPSDEYAEWLEVAPWGYAGRLAGAGAALDLIWDHARKGELGQELKEFCSAPKSHLCQLRSFTEEVTAQIEQMPRGLTHTDFSRENTGRRITGELLVMDVEWVCLGPRFLDAAGWIGRPSDDGSFGALQHELGQHYLDEYARWGGAAPSVEEFLDDVRVLRLADIIRYLRWNLDRALGGWEASPADSNERRACCEHLMKTLPTFL